MNMGRRGILKLLGAAPAVAAMVPAIGVQAAGYGVAGIGAGSAMLGGVGPPVNSVPSGGTKFFSFANWLMEQGEKELREESRYVVMVDPDLAVMRLPLQTKVNMQVERNYKRRLEQRKNWFERTLKNNGSVEVW